MNAHSQARCDAGEFRTTHWSVVLEAGAGTEAARAALEALCRQYWYPLYAFVRRRGHDPTEAEDLTQEFFARLLASGGVTGLSQEKGRFRAFLLAALKNFLANEWDKASRLKRGGGNSFVSLDELDPEARLAVEPASSAADEVLFDRQWARALTARVMERLRTEAERDDTIERFEALKVFLASEPTGESYDSLATRLGLSVSAVKSAIHRLRRRYGQLLRAQVADTVREPGDVEDEIRHLFAALAASSA